MPHQPIVPPPPGRGPGVSDASDSTPPAPHAPYRVPVPDGASVPVGTPSVPSRAARRVRRIGVPLVPLLVAGLVVTAFTAVGGEAERGTAAAPPAAGDAPTPTSGPAEADTPVTGAPVPPPADRRADPHEERAVPVPSPTPTATVPAVATTAPATARPHRGGSAPASRTGTPAPSHRTPRAPVDAPAPGRGVSFEDLRVGDCFDIDRAAPGTVVRRACDTPHDAEVVARPLLPGPYADDGAVREAATALCRLPLRHKADLQPVGTRWTTFVQYPYRTSHLLGSDRAACSLATPSGTETRLTRPLQ
ncbi:hypothetical protein GCM10022244_02310 [Streptomyces gulbargensis]|uniref:Septum formation-related domain-containing protein n=1 Tax=Streptomyces gulbargensis TaxID=364901 RepID=A0ABP7L7U5_9ACTN